MKRLYAAVAMLALFCTAAVAEQRTAFLTPLRNATFVYVTSYDGSQFSSNPLPEDRAAISAVQNAFQKWGRYVVVYNPAQADMVVAVESRGSEDILAVYSQQTWRDGTYLWRSMGKDGLSAPGVPLFAQLKAALMEANGEGRPEPNTAD